MDKQNRSQKKQPLIEESAQTGTHSISGQQDHHAEPVSVNNSILSQRDGGVFNAGEIEGFRPYDRQNSYGPCQINSATVRVTSVLERATGPVNFADCSRKLDGEEAAFFSTCSSTTTKSTENGHGQSETNCAGISTGIMSGTTDPVLRLEQVRDILIPLNHRTQFYQMEAKSESRAKPKFRTPAVSPVPSLHYSLSGSSTPLSSPSASTPSHPGTPTTAQHCPFDIPTDLGSCPTSDPERIYREKEKEGVKMMRAGASLFNTADTRCVGLTVELDELTRKGGKIYQKNQQKNKQTKEEEHKGSPANGSWKAWWPSNIAVIVPGESSRDHLALERTFFSYHRLSLIFAISACLTAQLHILSQRQQNQILSSSSPSSLGSNNPHQSYDVLGKPLSIMFSISAILVSLVGWWRWYRWQKALMRGKGLMGGWELEGTAGYVLLVGCVGFGIVLVVLITGK